MDPTLEDLLAMQAELARLDAELDVLQRATDTLHPVLRTIAQAALDKQRAQIAHTRIRVLQGLVLVAVRA